MTDKRKDNLLEVWLTSADGLGEEIYMENVSKISVDTIAVFIDRRIPLREEIYEKCKSNDLAIACTNEEGTVVYPLSCYNVQF